ncbi:hypothetical protein C8R43DRAFT_1134752 [Mycena crocata]|nr:hypothetical protein C8R43DRAFT_1134752 [Mycena crocata]
MTQSRLTSLHPIPPCTSSPSTTASTSRNKAALPPGTRVRIQRQLNQCTVPSAVKGAGMFIRDIKSSNRTFINGERLSAEGADSAACELRSDVSPLRLCLATRTARRH